MANKKFKVPITKIGSGGTGTTIHVTIEATGFNEALKIAKMQYPNARIGNPSEIK